MAMDVRNTHKSNIPLMTYITVINGIQVPPLLKYL